MTTGPELDPGAVLDGAVHEVVFGFCAHLWELLPEEIHRAEIRRDWAEEYGGEPPEPYIARKVVEERCDEFAPIQCIRCLRRGYGRIPKRRPEAPLYSKDAAQAWKVLTAESSAFARHLHSTSSEVFFRLCHTRSSEGSYHLEYAANEGIRRGPTADTPERAICLAALEALGEEASPI